MLGFVLEHLDAVMINLGCDRPFADGTPVLRTLQLTPMMLEREPAGRWPDGTPVSASVTLSLAETERAVRALDAEGFFAQAFCDPQGRKRPPSLPPARRERGFQLETAEKHVRVAVVVFTQKWSCAFHVRRPWTAEGRALLERVAEVLDVEGRALIGGLTRQLPAA